MENTPTLYNKNKTDTGSLTAGRKALIVDVKTVISLDSHVITTVHFHSCVQTRVDLLVNAAPPNLQWVL